MKSYHKIEDFDYSLPKDLIAKYPLNQRDECKLLVDDNFNPIVDTKFSKIVDYIKPNDLLVLNNTKVIKARLFGSKPTGGKIEILVERIITPEILSCHIRSNKTINLGLIIELPENLRLEVIDKSDGLFKVKILNHVDIYEYLEQYGLIPIPPYINRQTETLDNQEYQTIYAQELGSVAAPTAGLHFTQELLKKIRNNGTQIAYVTLHVGSGTFKPVTVANINQHKMHRERYHISSETIKLIRQTQENQGNIIAVGTTSLRALEATAKNNYLAGEYETDIFITPGFEFNIVTKLITNFHLPKSTLLMLVSAFAGYNEIKKIYHHAINNNYRFFSYGDAMLLSLNNKEQT